MADITIHPLNESFILLDCNEAISKELRDYYTFYADGYKFSPKFRAKIWDGKVRLISKNMRTYRGLAKNIKTYAETKGYSVEWIDDDDDEFSVKEMEDYIETLGLPFPPRDYQADVFLKSIRKRRNLIVSATSCHVAGDKVLMADGIFKNIEDVVIGDKVIGADGNLKQVLNTFQGEEETYKLQPKGRSKKQAITVTKNHKIPLKFSDYNKPNGYAKGDVNHIEYVTVEDYIKKPNYFKHCASWFYNDKEINFQNINVETILDPYFIGLYLGDGHTHTIAITNADSEIEEYLLEYVKKFPELNIRTEKTKSKASTYFLTHGERNKSVVNTIKSEFAKLGLFFENTKKRTKCEDKFIPDVCKTAPIEFRLNLLAGLIDSDGSRHNDDFDFCVKSKKLANDISDLSIGLGLSTTLSERVLKNIKYYRVKISGNTYKVPCKINRKKCIDRPYRKDQYRCQFNVIPKGVQKFYGIEVEDHLYITNNGLITHNSGKSMMIYLILKYLYDKSYCKNLLVIVPTTSLVVQLTSDLASYGLDTDNLVHCVYDGAARKTSKPITISTFQALANEDRKFFQKWDAVFLDEAHQGKAASITYEINACVNAKYRFGFTGTLNESKIHHLILEGLFAAPYKAAQAHELIAAKTIAPLEIKALALKYEKAEAALVSKMSYQEEIDFLCSHPQRNAFIVNLALSLKTNTLVLFQYVEKHGQPLFDMISQSAKKGRKVFYVYGGTETDERDQIRKIVETEKDAIIVASAGVFATGINIKNLHNVIFAHAGKSKIRTLQSIGRSLRAHPDKEKATLFDISDNLKYRNRDNFSLKHLYHRLRYYTDEKFPFKVYNIELAHSKDTK